MKARFAAATIAFASLGASLPAAAQATSGPTLLDASREAQLERWLGAGDVSFAPIFTGTPGLTSIDFHSAADGKGPTFTLLKVSSPEGASYLVGGYNPQSWSSTDGWHETPFDSQRTAFLFNMTVPAVYHQVPATYILPSQGLRQTFNAAGHGPEFGAGPDLFVNDRLDSAFSWQVTYGDPLDQGKSIFDRSVGAKLFHIDALQLFAVSPVPEPTAAFTLAGGIALIVALARRKERAIV
jgi:TLD